MLGFLRHPNLPRLGRCSIPAMCALYICKIFPVKQNIVSLCSDLYRNVTFCIFMYRFVSIWNLYITLHPPFVMLREVAASM